MVMEYSVSRRTSRQQYSKGEVCDDIWNSFGEEHPLCEYGCLYHFTVTIPHLIVSTTTKDSVSAEIVMSFAIQIVA